MKASLKIGSKIPYVSGSLNSAVATPGSIPYATTQFQQIDVGVNIDLQPHVNSPHELSMHVKVEVSSVTSTETIGGIQQPIIGQRINEADLRMRDGEVTMLGGLTSDSDTQSVAGIPGITNMPVLGYLFGTHSKDKEKDDIIIAIVPHIVREPGTRSQREIMAGTERVPKVLRQSLDQNDSVSGADSHTSVVPANGQTLGKVLASGDTDRSKANNSVATRINRDTPQVP
jgi:general secretion pathway protein D